MDNHINHDASWCVSVREDVIEGAPVRVSRRETMRATVGGIALVASGAVSGLVGASTAEAMGGESTSRNVYLPATDAGETGANGFSIVPPVASGAGEVSETATADRVRGVSPEIGVRGD